MDCVSAAGEGSATVQLVNSQRLNVRRLITGTIKLLKKIYPNFILLAKANQVAPCNSKEGGKYNPSMCPKDSGNIWYITLMTTMTENFPNMERTMMKNFPNIGREMRCWTTKIQEDKCPLEISLFVSFLYGAMLSLAQ